VKLGKTTGGFKEVNGKPVLVDATLTRAQKKSTREIPLTPGPRTRWQKFKRATIG
jgi:hypothetical protein